MRLLRHALALALTRAVPRAGHGARPTDRIAHRRHHRRLEPVAAAGGDRHGHVAGHRRPARRRQRGRRTLHRDQPAARHLRGVGRARRIPHGRADRHRSASARSRPSTCRSAVAAMAETVTVTADTGVLDASSAKIGVNVTPEEVDNLPVNGRNFANLMTLSPGATSDGNGGWSSIRFNGKSNQQNYLNYDGVDGTYVWDASPGYLNATGSQFRLQTSMESVAEFRVNAGLSPAESGLGTGGNITVVTKSGANRFTGSLFEYYRDDALDATNKYDDIKQPLRLDQFGGSIGGPIVSNKVFFFGSYEGLRQDTGLSFVESVPSNLARDQILAGVPTTSGGGRSPERTRAVAPLLAGFPTETLTSSNPLVGRTSNSSVANQTRGLVHRPPRLALLEQPEHVRAVPLQRRRDRHARPVGDTAPGPRDADAAELRGQLAVDRAPDGGQRAQGRLQPAGHGGGGVRSDGLPGRAGVARRARSVRRPSTAAATRASHARVCSCAPRAPRRAAARCSSPTSFSFTDAITMTRGTHTFKAGGEYRAHQRRLPVPRRRHLRVQQRRRLHRQPSEPRAASARLARVRRPAAVRDRRTCRTPGARRPS